MTPRTYLPSRAEGIERLRTLYMLLASVPKPYLRLAEFVSMGAGFNGDETEPILVQDMVHNCGSTACALGWAALYPEFRELGLSVDTDEVVSFNGVFEFTAGARFFALTDDEADGLFGSRMMTCASKAMHRMLTRGLPDELGLVSDKRLALHRIRMFLELTDAITPARSAELAKIEEGY